MIDKTISLIDSLTAVAERVPGFVAGLTAGTLSPATQHTFGSVLTVLGDEVHRHADLDTPAHGRHALREPPIEGGERA